MQLCQTEFVRPVDNDGVGIGDVDAGFDNGAADQNMVAHVVKIGHDPLQLCFPELSVSHADGKFGQQLPQLGSCLFYRFDLVVQVVNLPAAQRLPQDRLFHQRG